MRRIFGAMSTKMADRAADQVWREMMAQPASKDGMIPDDDQIADVRDKILAFFRTLPAAT